MNLKVEKSSRSKGLFHQRSKGFDCMKAKAVAMKDITKYCKINYVYKEYLVLNMCKLNRNEIN